MKQILVAIDFSKCSIHALKYAIFLAKKMQSNIMMVWVDTSGSAESVYQAELPGSRKEITNNFEELISEFKKDLIGVEIAYKIRKGKVHHEVANQAKYIDAELVIAGTHGVSGFEEFWVGSNAYRIVTHAPCPVITIRADYQFNKNIDKIILPIDSSLETRQKVPYTCKIARVFGSEVHIVSLYSTTIKAVRNKVDNYTTQVIKFLEEENVSYLQKTIATENISKSVINYAKDENADFIAIMTEQETTTANLFLGAYAQQMVNHSTVPVLNVHAKEFIITSSR
jgi:nucleotide-binding universal stress UspA family protein